MTKLEDVLLWSLAWTLSFFAALTVVCGKIGYALFFLGEAPPDDPQLAKHWRRKRLWLTISELSAVPAFATVGISATFYFKLDPMTSVPIAMVLGGLGFGFLLDGVKRIARDALKRKVGGAQ